VLRTDRASLHQAEMLHDLPARHAVDVGQDQESPLRAPCSRPPPKRAMAAP
jgi:hypothetical protein